MENVKYSYEQFYYDRYWPLIHQEFQFFIWSGDAGGTPGDLAPEGYWNRTVEIGLAEHMMDRNFVPTDPLTQQLDYDKQIDSMQMEWSFSDPGPVPSNLEGAPAHTLEAFVNFDLQVDCVGETDFAVTSRPKFYFIPADSTVPQPWTWTIWRIDDGENLTNP